MASDNFPEEWRAVPGWPYEVSNHGRVRRTVTVKGSSAGRFIKGRLRQGYARVALTNETRVKDICIHQLVVQVFVGPRPSPAHEVAHWDGNRLNNRVSNLRWATRIENVDDNRRLGRIERGEEKTGAKLNAEQVVMIRRSSVPAVEIGAQLGVTKQTIYSVRRRATWTHVE